MVQQPRIAKNVSRVTLPAATLIRAKYSWIRKTFDCLKMEFRSDGEFCLFIAKVAVGVANTIVSLLN